MTENQHKYNEICWFGTPENLSPEIMRKSPPLIPFKSDPVDFTQSKLTPIHIFQYIPKNHDCFIYADIFKELDFSSLFKNYSPIGQHAYNPIIIASILIYAYCHGIFSSRLIEFKCHVDLGFMYISHLNCPNFRVLSDFRKTNLEFFQNLFTQTVAIGQELNLVDLKNVCQDGSKFKADTSKHKAMSYGRMKRNIAELNQIIKELLEKIDQIESTEDNHEIQDEYHNLKNELQIKENRLKKILAAKEALETREEHNRPEEKIPDKSQISFADTDARIMGKKGSFDYSYNGQICVDSKKQIIVGQFLTQNANDKQEIDPALLNILWNTGRLPDSMSFDNGYFSGYNLEALAKYGVNAYVAVGREGKQNPDTIEIGKTYFSKYDFIFSEEDNAFICPEGQKMQLKYCDKEGKRTYSGNKDICLNCQRRSICCKSKKGQPRTISVDDYESLRKEMRIKMKDSKSKEIYSRRKVVVEPVFGQIKDLGFRGFHMRGFDKVSGEFALVCSTHNLRKVVNLLRIDILFGSQRVRTQISNYPSKESSKGVMVNSIKLSIKAVKKSQLKIKNLFTNLIFSRFYGKLCTVRKSVCSRTAS